MTPLPRIFLALLLMTLTYLVGGFLEAAYRGPYTTWYNQRCLRLATEANLVGKPEGAVVPILGAPTYVSRGWSVTDSAGKPTVDAVWNVTYGYAPYPFLPGAVFQVHLTGGTVTSLEMFDD